MELARQEGRVAYRVTFTYPKRDREQRSGGIQRSSASANISVQAPVVRGPNICLEQYFPGQCKYDIPVVPCELYSFHSIDYDLS